MKTTTKQKNQLILIFEIATIIILFIAAGLGVFAIIKIPGIHFN